MKQILKLIVLLAGMSFANFAAASEFFTLPEMRAVLLNDYGFSQDDTDRVMNSIQSYSHGNPLPVSGIMWTNGFTFSFIGGTGHWHNIETSFKDPLTKKRVTTDCMYDMWYRNGGLVASVGYKWVMMFMLGDTPINQLNDAVYGRGAGLSLAVGAGVDMQYLMDYVTGRSMIVLSPIIGFAAGVRLPQIQFKPAEYCSRP